jgi:sugar phosphate permease
VQLGRREKTVGVVQKPHSFWMTCRARTLPTSAAAGICSTIALLPAYLLGTLLLQMRHSLALSTELAALFVSLSWAAAALSSVPFGHLSERFGGGRLVRLSTAWSSLTLLGLGLARSPAEVGVSVTLAGLANGASPPATNLLLLDQVPAASLGRAFAIKQSSAPFAGLLAGLAVPLIGLTIGWRWAYIGLGVAGMLLVAFLPRQASASGKPRIPNGTPTGRLRLRGPLMMLTLAFGLGVGASTALGFFVVPYGVRSGWGIGEAGFIAAAASAMAIVTRLVAGFCSDRLTIRLLGMCGNLLLLGSAGYFLLAVGGRIAFVIGATCANGVGFGWNGLFNLGLVRAYPTAPGRATALTQVGGNIGCLVPPFVFSLILAHGTYRTAWAIVAGAAAVGGLLMFAGDSGKVSSGGHPATAARPANGIGLGSRRFRLRMRVARQHPNHD